MKKEEPKLGEILIRKGWLSPPALEEALSKQKKTRQFLGEILLADRKITDEQLAMALAEQSGLAFVRLANFYVDWPLVFRFSSSLILEKKCFPLRVSGNEITFALTNTLDAWTVSQIEQESRGYRVRLTLVTQKDMNELMARYREYVNIKVRKQLDSEQ